MDRRLRLASDQDDQEHDRGPDEDQGPFVIRETVSCSQVREIGAPSGRRGQFGSFVLAEDGGSIDPSGSEGAEVLVEACAEIG